MAINKRWGAIKTLKNFIQVSNSEKQKSNLLELNKTQIKKKKKTLVEHVCRSHPDGPLPSLSEKLCVIY